MWKLVVKFIFPTLLFLGVITSAHAWDKGIYLTQYTLEQPEKLDYLIREAKATDLNTFVIDHEYFSSRYAPAMAKVKAAGIKRVVRVVVFADGGNAKQIRSRAYWEERYKLVEEAIDAGANVVQLDYIRYSSKSPANPHSTRAKSTAPARTTLDNTNKYGNCTKENVTRKCGCHTGFTQSARHTQTRLCYRHHQRTARVTIDNRCQTRRQFTCSPC